MVVGCRSAGRRVGKGTRLMLPRALRRRPKSLPGGAAQLMPLGFIASAQAPGSLKPKPLSGYKRHVYAISSSDTYFQARKEERQGVQTVAVDEVPVSRLSKRF